MDEVIQLFEAHRVRYLLIGGQALRLEGMPRFTMDWDVYIPGRDNRNIRLINRLLGDELEIDLVPLGAHGENFVQTYQTRWGILQFHLGGPGLPPFDEAESRAKMLQTETGLAIRCLSGRDLLESKRRAGRPQDLDDIRFLEKKAEAGLL